MCLQLWNRSKKGYDVLQKSGFVKLPSGRTLQLRKNSVRQTPGLHKEIMKSMKEAAKKQNIAITAYHGFIVFDEMSIQVI